MGKHCLINPTRSANIKGCMCQNCLDCRSYSKAYYRKNREKCILKASKYTIKYPEKKKKYARAYNLHLKELVIEHYSPTKCCSRCGFDDIRALSLDHINSDGNFWNKKLNMGGMSFYEYVKRNWPKGLQVLCMNCQFIKRYECGEFAFKYRRISTKAEEEFSE